MDFKKISALVLIALNIWLIKSLYLVTAKQGFKFGFKKIDKRTVVYFHFAILLACFLSLGHSVLKLPTEFNLYFMYFLIIVTLFSVGIYFSYKRDSDEVKFFVTKFESKQCKEEILNE